MSVYVRRLNSTETIEYANLSKIQAEIDQGKLSPQDHVAKSVKGPWNELKQVKQLVWNQSDKADDEDDLDEFLNAVLSDEPTPSEVNYDLAVDMAEEKTELDSASSSMRGAAYFAPTEMRAAKPASDGGLTSGSKPSHYKVEFVFEVIENGRAETPLEELIAKASNKNLAKGYVLHTAYQQQSKGENLDCCGIKKKGVGVMLIFEHRK